MDELGDAVGAASAGAVETQEDHPETLQDVDGTNTLTPASSVPPSNKEDPSVAAAGDSHLSPQDIRRARRIRVRLVTFRTASSISEIQCI